MGLFENLRHLFGSDVGSKIDDVLRELRRLRSEVDDLADLSERRWRKFRKRAHDENEEPAPDDAVVPRLRKSGNPRLDRLRARRMRRVIAEAPE